MRLEELFVDKTIKAKAKVAQIGGWLLNGDLAPDELLAFAESQSGTNKATCIESLEYATKKDPRIAGESVLTFVTAALADKEPRVKWESAKVIGNIAGSYPDRLAGVIRYLLVNVEHPGTVVRWATAYALAEIVKLKTPHNDKLIPRIEALGKKEEDEGVRKKYLDALKKIKK